MTVLKEVKSRCYRMVPVVALLTAATVVPLGQAYAEEKAKKPEKSVAQVWEELQTAVKAGEMTKEDALKKITAVKKERYKGDKTGSSVDTYFKEVWAKLMVAVKDGKLTKEDAGEKMAAIKKEKMAGIKKEKLAGKRDAELWAIWGKLLAAVKAGEMTQEEADAKMTAIKEKSTGKK